MKSFDQYLVELAMRHTLPQVRDLEAFRENLIDGKVGFKEDVKLSPKTLKPTQSNFNQEKVDRIIQAKSMTNKPVVVSSDNKIIDGHHRWMAAKQTKTDIRAWVVDLSCDELQSFLKGKPYCEKRGINE